MNLIKVNAVEAKNLIKGMLEVDVPVFLHGSPGIGKSDLVREIAKEGGYEFIDLRLTLLDPVDLRGLPSTDSGRTVWNPPDFVKDKGKGILMLDEINAAPPSIQVGAYQLVLDRALGSAKLGKDWRIVAAGNLLEDKAVVYNMPTPLINRFAHLHLLHELEPWKVWAFANKVEEKIISFLNYRPELLFKLSSNGPFPSPRSWALASKVFKLGAKAIDSCVGEGAGSELQAFLKINIPDVEKILEGSLKFKSKEASMIYAMGGALIGALKRKKSDNRFSNFLKTLDNIPVEFQVVWVMDILSSGVLSNKDKKHPVFREWLSKHADFIL